MSLNTKPRVRRVNLLIALAILLTAGTVGIVYAFLAQQIPSTTIPQSTVASACSSLSTSSTVTASSGAIKYSCGTTPAFTTIGGTSTPSLTGGFTVCPAQVIAPCYSNFGYMASSDTTDCVSGSTISAWFHPIANNTAITFTAGSWDYCAFYAATSTGGSLPGFSISWSP